MKTLQNIILGLTLAGCGAAQPQVTQEPEAVYVEKEVECKESTYTPQEKDCYGIQERNEDECEREKVESNIHICAFPEAKAKLGLGVESKCILYKHGTPKMEKCMEDFIDDEKSQAKVVERFKPCYDKIEQKFNQCIEREKNRFDRCQKQNERNYKTQKR